METRAGIHELRYRFELDGFCGTNAVRYTSTTIIRINVQQCMSISDGYRNRMEAENTSRPYGIQRCRSIVNNFPGEPTPQYMVVLIVALRLFSGMQFAHCI